MQFYYVRSCGLGTYDHHNSGLVGLASRDIFNLPRANLLDHNFIYLGIKKFVLLFLKNLRE